MTKSHDLSDEPIFPRHILVGHALSAKTKRITDSLAIETALEAVKYIFL